jgi:MFS family permease
MAGMGVLAVGLFLLSRLNQASPPAAVVLALAVAGLGIGTFISPNSNSLLGSAPRNRQGIASGLLATARNVGMVLGVGLSGAIFTTILSQGSEGDAAILFKAIQVSFSIIILVAVTGVFTSAIRGNKQNHGS